MEITKTETVKTITIDARDGTRICWKKYSEDGHLVELWMENKNAFTEERVKLQLVMTRKQLADLVVSVVHAMVSPDYTL